MRNTIIDFRSLGLPDDVAEALAEAFWHHFGVLSDRTITKSWTDLRIFGRFASEWGAIASVKSLDGDLLARYVEWLNAQRRADGKPWSKATRASPYSAIRKLLQWLERCRPDLVKPVVFPFNPFPWRNRDTPNGPRLTALELRRLLTACEADIEGVRAIRQAVLSAEHGERGVVGSLSWLLSRIESKFGGVVPPATELAKAGNYSINKALKRHGGLKGVEPHLYPRLEVLVPYYLALLIHTAGNPDPIIALGRDCLQPLPLLDDREALVWFKARANSTQRRTFNKYQDLEPPSLVREILTWNKRLVQDAPTGMGDRLLLYRSRGQVSAMTASAVKHQLPAFCERHALPRFSLASIRPSVLTSFYRSGGDLRHVSKVANHANLATTVRYVTNPEVLEQNRTRIAVLQNAFVGSVRSASSPTTPKQQSRGNAPHTMPPGQLVSLFGFDCEDPYAGAAPGSQQGRLCTNFMGCFTCPNAVITAEPATVARLLQAKTHLHESAASLHPARWEAFYAPLLRILEEDIIPRFSAAELAAAKPLLASLTALPDLR